MPLSFDNADMPVRCPKCRREFKEPLRRFKNNDTVRCPGCGEGIRLVLENPGELRKVDDALASLRKALGNFGKRR